MTTQSREVHRLSLPSHLLWRSVLGNPAAWSGSSSRGVCSLDPNDIKDASNGRGCMVASDKRMFHLPVSLRDALLFGDTGKSPGRNVQLLSHPRIVGAARPRSNVNSSGRAVSGTSDGISCMDLDRGADGGVAGSSPPRYLLVGAGGGDCSIALYDLSYFGSDDYVARSNAQRHRRDQHCSLNQQTRKSTITHRVIARSLRGTNHTSSPEENRVGGVPRGHRQVRHTYF